MKVTDEHRSGACLPSKNYTERQVIGSEKESGRTKGYLNGRINKKSKYSNFCTRTEFLNYSIIMFSTLSNWQGQFQPEVAA